MKIITKDLYEASYLLAKGTHLDKVLKDRKTVLFQFEGKEDLEVLKSKFDQGRAEVNVRRLRNSINHLRDIIFSKA
jgi:hypothetical protein